LDLLSETSSKSWFQKEPWNFVGQIKQQPSTERLVHIGPPLEAH
jgi:hypothetical protein